MTTPAEPRSVRFLAGGGAFLASCAFIAGASWIVDGLGMPALATRIVGGMIWLLGVGLFYFLRWLALAMWGY